MESNSRQAGAVITEEKPRVKVKMRKEGYFRAHSHYAETAARALFGKVWKIEPVECCDYFTRYRVIYGG